MAKIGLEEIRKAKEIYEKYKNAKQPLDDKIRANEAWFKQQHWAYMHGPQDERRKSTGWLFAAIVNRHADFLDNKPEVTVLAREKSDEAAAKIMTEIMPVILKRAGWNAAYDAVSYAKIKQGTGWYGCRWVPTMEDGLGGIMISHEDALNLFWEPGVEDIQESRNVFLKELVDTDVLKEQYKDNEDLQKIQGPAADVNYYYYDQKVDTSNMTLVLNWYYRDKNGKLQYCRFCDDVVLFASENEKGYEDGWYKHGLYPFIPDTLFPEPGTVHGFGMIDMARDTQEDLDQLNDLIMRNAKIASRRRWLVGDGAKINEAELMNLDADIVHFSGTLDDMRFREMGVEPYSGTFVQIYQNKVDELKENIHSRDVTSGGAPQTNTASGIASLMETGAKASRDAIQASYRAFEKLVEMVIELIREFYDTPRIFRIVGEDKQARYETFDNSMIAARPITGIEEDFGTKKPVFDLDIRVNKANLWSRQANNQDVMNFFQMGFFAPQNSTQALACLEVLEIDNKERLVQTIRQNGLKEQFVQKFLPLLLQIAEMADPKLGAAAQQAAVQAGLVEAQPVTQPQPGEGPQRFETPAERGAQQAQNYMDRQRQIAAARTAPQA